MSKRLIALGNRDARMFSKNPKIPKNLEDNLAEVENWATKVCGLDVSGIPAVGESVLNSEGEPDYTVTEQHRIALLLELIERLVEVPSPYVGQKLCTLIDVSPQSTVRQAIDEICRCWNRQSSGKPAWISGTDQVLVSAIAEELGVEEIREFEVPK